MENSTYKYISIKTTGDLTVAVDIQCLYSQSVGSQDAYQLLNEDYKHHPCDEHRNSQLLQEKIAIYS